MADRSQRSKTAASGPRRDVLTADVLEKAAQLFAAKGFAGTSLQDVAERVGLSRTSIYHYFDSKDALLNELVRSSTRPVSEIFQRLEQDASLSPSDRLREAAHRLVLWVIDPRNHFKLIDRSEHELPPHIAEEHRKHKRNVLVGMTRLIEAGIAAGAFRAVDPRVAAFSILGMCNWTAWWFSPEGERPAGFIASEVADLAVNALLRHDGAPAADLRGLTASIRASLDIIDAVHAQDRGLPSSLKSR